MRRRYKRICERVGGENGVRRKGKKMVLMLLIRKRK